MTVIAIALVGLALYFIAFTLICFGAGTRLQWLCLVIALLLVLGYGGYLVWLLQTYDCEVCHLP